MSSITCPICKKTYFDFQRHVCGKPYECRAGGEDESQTFYCTDDDLERVSEEFAEKVFYDWDCPNSLDIEILNPETEEWQKFHVEVEPVPTFSSTAYQKYSCVDCETEFESTAWKPKRCYECDRKHRMKEYEEWKANQKQ